MFKKLKQEVATTDDREVVRLAEKYNVPFINGYSNAGCPGALDPLGKTSPIELRWGSGQHKADEVERFNQFHKALLFLDDIDNEDSPNILELNLTPRGFAMLVFIAGKNLNLKDKVFDIINGSIEGIYEILQRSGDTTHVKIIEQYVHSEVANYCYLRDMIRNTIPKALQDDNDDADNGGDDNENAYDEGYARAAGNDEIPQDAQFLGDQHNDVDNNGE